MFTGRCYTCGGALGYFGANVAISGRVVAYNCRRCAGVQSASPIAAELPASMFLVDPDVIVCDVCGRRWRIREQSLAQGTLGDRNRARLEEHARSHK
jgi:hypothetical protein